MPTKSLASPIGTPLASPKPQAFQLRQVHEEWIREHIDEYRYDWKENHTVVVNDDPVNLLGLALELNAAFEGLDWHDGTLMYEVYRFCEQLPTAGSGE
jgi:hypothetical protein